MPRGASRTCDVRDLVLFVPGRVEPLETAHVHLGRVLVGRLRPLRSRHLVAQRRVRIQLEQVQRRVVRVRLDQRVQVRQPVGDALLGQPHHQIQADVLETRGARLADDAPGAIRGMNAAKPLQLRVLKGLHAETETVHAGGAKRIELRAIHRLRVRLERGLHVARHRECRPAGLDQRRDVARLEQRRRPAAEEDRVRGGTL